MNVLIEGAPLPGPDAILQEIEVEASEFMWHVADVEATGWPQYVDGGWITGSKFVEYCVPHNTQFVWGVLDAFARGDTFEVIDPPFSDGNASLWTGAPLAPQMAGARFEIVYWDSSAIFIIGLGDCEGDRVLNAFPNAKQFL
jgi:hypothetical protein